MEIIQSSIVPITLKDLLSALARRDGLDKFREMFSEITQCDHVIFTNSGISSLYALFRVYGIEKGDVVVVPAYLCEKVVRFVLDYGCRVRFVDVDASYNISAEELKGIKEAKAVIAVHMFGNPCDMNAIREVSHDRGAVVIEDSAQCIGAKYDTKKVGSLGDSAFFSFGKGKPITTMRGGAITTNDDDIAKRLESLSYGRENFSKVLMETLLYYIMSKRWLYGFFHGKIEDRRNIRWEKLKNYVGFDIGDFTKFQASLGVEQLKKLEEFNEIRVRNSKLLMEHLKHLEGIRLPTTLPNAKPIFLRFPIYMENENLKHWLHRSFKEHRIDVTCAYPNYLPDFFGINGDCPKARELVRGTLALPVHPCVGKEDVMRMIEIIKGLAE